MAEPMRLQLLGSAQLMRNLTFLGQRAPHVLGGALYRFGEMVMTESKREVPVKTGTLRGSGHVEPPEVTPRGAVVVLGYGGPAEAYATIVHEDTSRYHKPPTKAKYLEDPLKAHAGEFEETVGRDVAAALFGHGAL